MAEPRLTVLSVFNRYQQRGGEEQVVEAERALLERKGCRVVTADAVATQPGTNIERAKMARDAVWSEPWYDKIQSIVFSERPEVVHIHNSFPVMSPSIYHACRSSNVAVVQTLHNYRLLCPQAMFYRDGKPCEECLGRSLPWPGMIRGCYRQSRAATAVVGMTQAVHRLLGTWHKTIHRYITPTEFTRQKYIAGGFPGSQIVVKPHFLDPDPGPRDLGSPRALFVGRLSEEKGIATLLAAWRLLRSEVPLTIVGDGPLWSSLRAQTCDLPLVEWLGQRPKDVVKSLIGDASLVVFPSECYETFGMVVIEAFAKGVPVVATRGGAAAELILDGRNGLLFNNGDSADLASKLMSAFSNPGELCRMGMAARADYLSLYTGDSNFERLMDIYNSAVAECNPGMQLRKD